jgi:thiol-disulfide isomerase/thioredoxin
MAGGNHGQTDYSWPLTSPDGVRHDLGEFRDRVIVLSRWATWCTPCLAELKTVENLSLDLPNVAFLAITTEDVDVIQDHLQRRPMAAEVLISEGGDPSPFGAPVLPTSFVIDCDGQVIFKHVGAANWDSADARQLLGDLVQACHSSVPAAG